MADGLVIPGPEEEFERKGDFEKPTFSLSGVSTDIRPDALSFDHLTAFSLGPIEIGDTSKGAVFKPWRIRFVKETGEFFIQPNGGSETLLFSTNEQDVREVDLAFTQNADPVVCVQVGDDIWLYWFDPQINDFTFVKLGPGRNPRIVLDNPDIIPDSDVLLFYMSEDQDALVYRIQRERYENEYVTPVTGVINKFTEEAYKSSGNRLHVLYSERNPTTGRYSLRQLNSKLFPFILPTEGINVGVSVVSIQSVVVVFFILYELEAEGLEVSVDVVQVDLIDPLIALNILPEGLDISVDVVSTESTVAVIQLDILEEGLDISVDVQSVESPVILIQPNINPEGVDCSVEVQSVTLDTP